MPDPLPDRIMAKIEEATDLYHRLIILAAPVGVGKTSTLQEVHKCTGAPLLNVNLSLSRRMLELTERQRALQLPRLLSEMLNSPEAEVFLLDNIEILFDVTLKQDPLRLLQGLSRNKTVVAAWNGSVEHGHIVYASPYHPEYKRYPIQDLLIVNPEVAA